MMSISHANARKHSITEVALLCTATFLLIAAARILVLMASGSSIPFWDQWGGESGILGAFQNGTLTWAQLLSAHNEHRIFWTRLLTVALFELNGWQWDNQVEAIASNLIYCIALTVPVIAAATNLRRTQTIALALAVILAGALPFGWENTLVGFQSQFYINALLAFSAIMACSFLSIRGISWIFPPLMVAASILAMANGVLTAFCCAAVIALRCLTESEIRSRGVALIALLISIGITGYLLTPSPEYHSALKAQNLQDLFNGILITSSWPLPAGLGQLALVTPMTIWIFKTRHGRKNPADLFFFGLNLLGLFNAAAIAYSRGHDLLEITSRYTDTILPASIASFYFAIKLRESTRSSTSKGRIGLVFGCSVYAGLVTALLLQTAGQIPKLQERAYFLRMSTINTARFLNGDDAAFENQPHAHVPYPDPAHLGQSLRTNDQTLILPTSLLGVLARSAHRPPAFQRHCAVNSASRDHFTAISVNCENSNAPEAPKEGASIATGILSARLMQLKQTLGVSIFPRARAIPTPKADDSRCALDGLNERSTSQQNLTASIETPLRLSGWAPPPKLDFGYFYGPELKIAFSSERHAFSFDAGYARTERPDVVEALKNARYLRSGFDTIINVGELPPGKYQILVTSGSGSYCNTGHSVTLEHLDIPFAGF